MWQLLSAELVQHGDMAKAVISHFIDIIDPEGKSYTII
jgi:hypothetical protein